MRVLITGGAGFIGSALVRRLVGDGDEVLNVDALTYAGNPLNVADLAAAPNYHFLRADVADARAIGSAFSNFRPERVYHLAAESHVDRSIDGPAAFIRTNVIGTFVMLEAALAYAIQNDAVRRFHFVHVSTDEVYGSLGLTGLFTETTPYAPNSPYSASKAGSDHLVRAWMHTFGLQTVISNCSNNYGPRQNGEKLIPTIIRNALLGRPIPIYGDGKNVRDWLYVDDHVEAMIAVGERGRPGEKYNIGGHNEIQNIEIAQLICEALDELSPRADRTSYATQIGFVKDRPGHDRRYAIDASRARIELDWTPRHTFRTGLRKTVEWYLDHADYWRPTAATETRLGLGRQQHAIEDDQWPTGKASS